MERIRFSVTAERGELAGWVCGEGPRALAVHGGPGMNYDYLDDAVVELASSFQVATFQQRGLAPSTVTGEFTISEAVADMAAVMDGLGWDAAYLMGHSWGGHLVLHAAVAIPERIAGVLSVDPLRAVGDGGMEAFGAEMLARVPEAARERARVLDDKDTAGRGDAGGGARGVLALLAVVLRRSAGRPTDAAHGVLPAREPGPVGRSDGIVSPSLESSLPSITVPFGVLVGELSPMPNSAGAESAERIPGAWSHVEPGAGHFVWHEAPGCLLAAMDRLVAAA